MPEVYRGNLSSQTETIALAVLLVLSVWLGYLGPPQVWPVAPATQPSSVPAKLTLNLTEWTVPTSKAGLWGIGVDSFGKVWFAENATSKLGMLAPDTGSFYEWNVSGGGPSHLFLTQASSSGVPSTRVYFTEYGSDRIAYFENATNQLNTFHEWRLASGSKPVDIYVDDSSDIWFTESGRDIIGRLTPSTNQLTEWTLPDASFIPGLPSLQPWGIHVQVVRSTFAPTNHFVWFTEHANNKIGVLDVNANRLTLFDLNSLNNGLSYLPMDIAVDQNGNAIFSNINSNRISVLETAAGTVREYNILPTGAKPTSVALDSTGNVWFTEYDAGSIGYVNATYTVTRQLAYSATCVIAGGLTGEPTCPPPSTSVSRTMSSSEIFVDQVTPTSTTQIPKSLGLLTPLNSVGGVSDFHLPTAGSNPSSVTVDEDGNIWLTESSALANSIARLTIPSDFSISISDSTQNVTPGNSAVFGVTIDQKGGSLLPIHLSISTPEDMSATFSPQSGIPHFTSTLTIGSTTKIPAGTYPMTVTASNGLISRQLTITIIVLECPVDSPPFNYSITVYGPQTANITQGDSASYDLLVTGSGCPVRYQRVDLTVRGIPPGVSNFSLTTGGGLPNYTSVLRIRTEENTPNGSYVVSVTGISRDGIQQSADVNLRITALPRDFSLKMGLEDPHVALPRASRAPDLTLNAAATGVFRGPVYFSYSISPSADGLAVSMSPSSVYLEPDKPKAVTIKIVARGDTPSGKYVLVITGTASTDPRVTHDIQVEVTVSDCLIATASFGSELTPEVQLLRDFRDRQAMHTFAGSSFMTVFNAWYYSFSPAIAQYEYSHTMARLGIKGMLYPLIGILRFASASFSLFSFQPEIAILLAGVLASLLIGLAYLVLPLSCLLLLTRTAVKGRSRKKLMKALAALFIGLLCVFAVSELLELSGAMMLASAGLVLISLTAGTVLPACRIVEALSLRRRGLGTGWDRLLSD